ncbi:unnamed protein product [marine sediment metagenome]|uniref:Uncharacterized protein n=1 Tax=marine sediment metagenome TaxID=412755 RepID=X0ZY03_9ZZZZ
MAEILNTDQEQDDTTQDNPQLGGGQSSNLGEGTGGPQTQAVTAGGSSQQKGSGMGSRMSNLRKYIERNRGSGMAGKVQKGIEDIRGGVGTQIGSAKSQLQQSVASEGERLGRGEQLTKGTASGTLVLLK